MKVREVTYDKSDRVVGDRPVHEHRCTDGHLWACNSPYCDSVTAECPEHGGPEPIMPGREPWRGVNR